MDYNLSIDEKCERFFSIFKKIAEKKLNTLFPRVYISMKIHKHRRDVLISTMIMVAPKDTINFFEFQREATVTMDQVKTMVHNLHLSFEIVLEDYKSYDFIKHIVINELMMSICTMDMD